MYPWQSIKWDGSSRMGSGNLPTWGKQHRLCVPHDEAKARELMQKAADGGDQEAGRWLPAR